MTGMIYNPNSLFKPLHTSRAENKIWIPQKALQQLSTSLPSS